MKLPQLSLRELFLLALIVTLGTMWWIDHNVLKMGIGMSEQTRRAGSATMERMKLAMEKEGYLWEPSSQTMVKQESR